MCDLGSVSLNEVSDEAGLECPLSGPHADKYVRITNNRCGTAGSNVDGENTFISLSEAIDALKGFHDAAGGAHLSDCQSIVYMPTVGGSQVPQVCARQGHDPAETPPPATSRTRSTARRRGRRPRPRPRRRRPRRARRPRARRSATATPPRASRASTTAPRPSARAPASSAPRALRSATRRRGTTRCCSTRTAAFRIASLPATSPWSSGSARAPRRPATRSS